MPKYICSECGADCYRLVYGCNPQTEEFRCSSCKCVKKVPINENEKVVVIMNDEKWSKPQIEY